MNEVKRLSDEQKRNADEHYRKHQSLAEDLLNKVSGEHQTKHAELHNNISDQMTNFDKRLRDALSVHANSYESKHSSLAGGIAALEKKLREASHTNFVTILEVLACLLI